MNMRSRIVVAAALAGAAITPVVFHASALSAQPASSSAPLPCFTERAPQNSSNVTTPTNGAVVHVSVEVASTTRLQLDSSGHLKAVGTNSGCAPKAGDDFIIEKNNTYAIASPELVTAALACKTTGDWEDTTKMHRCL